MLTLILTIALVGFLLYLLETYLPMSQPLKLILRVVVVICVVLWLFQFFGVSDSNFRGIR